MKKALEAGDTTAAQWNAVTNLLKHCGISAIPAPGTPLGELVDAVENHEFPFAIQGAILPEDDPAVANAPAITATKAAEGH